jgi:hypothetical protein
MSNSPVAEIYDPTVSNEEYPHLVSVKLSTVADLAQIKIWIMEKKYPYTVKAGNFDEIEGTIKSYHFDVLETFTNIFWHFRFKHRNHAVIFKLTFWIC